MDLSRYRKYLPTRERLRESKTFSPIRHVLFKPDLWHMSRKNVSSATFIGLFCAFLPIPFQMVVAALFAIWIRANMPISVALVWISNPVTIGPMFFFAYKLGTWLLGEPMTVTNVEISWSWLFDRFQQIWWPLLFGSLICGWISGLTGAVVARLLWRTYTIRRWKERKLSRFRSLDG